MVIDIEAPGGAEGELRAALQALVLVFTGAQTLTGDPVSYDIKPGPQNGSGADSAPGGNTLVGGGDSSEQAGGNGSFKGGDGWTVGGLASLTAGSAGLPNDGVGGNTFINPGYGDAGYGNVFITSLPTTDPHIAEALWNNSGVLNISAG